MPIFTGGITLQSGMNFSNDPVPISATAGSVTSVSGITTAAITAFFPFTQVQNGTPPYTYFVSAGVLPTGITLNSSNGIVSGRPTVAQALGNVTFSVRDSNFVSAATTSTVGFTVVLGTYSVNYLVVGGGGAGGSNTGGGGGAGGYIAGPTNLTPTVPYTITVGSGGTSPGPGPATPGGNSSISGTCFSTITAIGGGAAGGNNGTPQNGVPGGSGGGGAGLIAPTVPGSGTTTGGTGTPGQGNPGGPGRFTSPTVFWGGGGGGAGCIGGAATPTAAGNGGNGLTWPFTAVTYAGGGGGSTPGATNGTGGSGGGGPGRGPTTPTLPATNGTPGLGGGGGGSNTGTGGGAGGSGVVILAVPTPLYSGNAFGGVVATNPPAAPGQTVLTWTSPGSYTA